MLSQLEKIREILAVPVAGVLFFLYFVFMLTAYLPYILRDIGVFPNRVCWFLFFIVFEGLLVAMLIWSIQRLRFWIEIASKALAFVPGTVIFSGVICVFSWVCTVLLIYFDYALVQLGRSSHGGGLPEDALPSPEAGTRPDNDPPINLTPSRSSTGDCTHASASKLWRFAERCSNALAKRAYLFSLPWETGEDETRRVLSIAFAVGNLLFATLYYCIKYDSTGTVKPSWTELLG